jgi:hypothetical protein
MSSNSPQKWFNLEEQFYKSLDNRLLDQLRDKEEVSQTAESIMKVTGITDKEIAAKMASLKISPSTLAAFCLVPLVAVAWASDDVDADEREVIDKAAKSAGLDETCLKLLAGWLNRRPGSELLEAWCSYTKALVATLNEGERKSLRDHVIGQATAVAKASGGVLGIGAISASEKATIEKIKAALE